MFNNDLIYYRISSTALYEKISNNAWLKCM